MEQGSSPDMTSTSVMPASASTLSFLALCAGLAMSSCGGRMSALPRSASTSH